MNDTLIFNFLMDLKKKEISAMDRAQIINDYLKANKMSQRELARQINVPHSTIQDWCMFSRLTEKEYKIMKHDNKLNDTQIYRTLRNNKTASNEEIVGVTMTQFELQKCIDALDRCKRSVDNTPKTKELILKLQNILNIMLMYNEKKKV
jgi:IS30 family transposase